MNGDHWGKLPSERDFLSRLPDRVEEAPHSPFHDRDGHGARNVAFDGSTSDPECDRRGKPDRVNASAVPSSSNIKTGD
jgi:hypothetical protein